jgi:serine O-acetyltransferase
MIYKVYKIASSLHAAKIPFLPRLFQSLIRLVFSAHIPFKSQIGEGTVLGYGGLGIVIHEKSIIGMKCIISSGVTIGGTSKKIGVPVIGDFVVIGSGAKILGPITIGANCVIGANAVVLTDVPANCLTVGVPARIVKENINIRDYNDILESF